MPFNLFAEIGLDGSKFAAGLHQIEGEAEQFGHKLGHVGEHIGASFAAAFGIAAIEAAAHRTIEYGAHIYDLSQRLAVGTDALQGWDYALHQSGGTIEDVTSFFEKLAVAREKALSGDPAAIEAFAKLKVSTDDLRTKRLEDLGLQIGEAVKEGDAQKLYASLRVVGGKGAGAMVAAFKAGIGESLTEAAHLGVIIEPETVSTLKQAEDEIVTMGKKITNYLAPAIAAATKILRVFNESWFAMIDTDKAFLSTLLKTGNVYEALFAGENAWQASKNASNKKDEMLREHAEKAKTGSPGEGGDEEVMDKNAVRHATEQLKLRERLEEITRKNNLNELSAAERINELTRERAEILNKMGPLSLEELTKAEEMRGELISLTKGKNLAPDNDSLAKIGGFIGNASKAGDPLMQISIEQLAVQRQIQVNTDPTRRPSTQIF